MNKGLWALFYMQILNKVIKDDNATQEEIDEILKNLEDAMDGLIEKDPSDQYLAKDEDFEYILSSSAPNIYENGQRGYYRYVGTNTKIKVPIHINGNELKRLL